MRGENQIATVPSIITEPPISGPQKGPPALCHWNQQNEAELGSEVKGRSALPSKNGEVATRASRVHTQEALGRAAQADLASSDAAEIL